MAMPPRRPTSSPRYARPWRRRAKRCAGTRGRAPGTRSATATCAASAVTTASACTSATCAGKPTMTAALLVADATDPARRRTACCRRSLWAALDCPSYVPAMWDADSPSVLARMQAELLEPIPLGEPIVATGWLLARRRPQALHRVGAAGGRRAPAGARHAPVDQAARRRGLTTTAAAPRGRCRSRRGSPSTRLAPTASSRRETSQAGGQTIAKRPPWARTSDAAPSSARRPVESQKSTSVRSTSRRGRRPARLSSSRAHSSGAVAMSSSPATAITRTPASSRSCRVNGSPPDGVTHRSTFAGSGRGVNNSFELRAQGPLRGCTASSASSSALASGARREPCASRRRAGRSGPAPAIRSR